MAANVEINGIDPSTYGLNVRAAPGLLSSPSLTYDPIVRPTMPGSAVGLRRIEAKPFQVEGLLESTSLSAARSALDDLMGLVTRQQPSTMIFAWSTDRRLVAECLGVQVDSLGSLFGTFKYSVRFLFDAPDPPFWEGTTEVARTFNGGGGSLVVLGGNAPMWPRMLVAGPSTTTTITMALRNSTSGLVGSIGFDVTLTSTQYFAVDFQKMTAYLNDSSSGSFNTGTPQSSARSAGDWWHIKPEHSNPASSSQASVSVSASTTAGITLSYRAAWY